MRFTVWYSDFKDFPWLRSRLNTLLHAEILKVIRIKSTHCITELKEKHAHNYDLLYEQ
jgi:hypothetical protein